VSQVGSTYVMQANARNRYGLPLLATRLAWDNTSTGSAVLSAGGSIPYRDDGAFYSQAADPDLRTVGYYFTQVPLGYSYGGWYLPLTPLPGDPEFSITNATPLLIAAVGDQSFKVAGYAKQALQNGYSNVFGYLGQYFDRAYQANPDGTASTNETGVLSEYGDFMPTEPGDAILFTKPDLSQTNSLQGQCMVHCIKLQLDVNHDGVMDLSFGGLDNTSPTHPFLFWINNDYDRWHDVGGDQEQDDLASNDREADCPYEYGRPVPDCEYRDDYGVRIMPSERDLEDFARLWFCGLTSNLVASLPPGVTGELSWGDKGQPNTNNPTIDIFGAALNPFYPSRRGSMSYLTNIFDSGYQTNRSYIGERLGPGDSVTVMSNGWVWSPCIWCGVKKGSGALTLTILQGGTNTLAQTSMHIKLLDIKEMYERHTVGDSPSIAPTNHARIALEGIPVPFQYPAPGDTNTPYILLVHDYDLPTWKKDRYAETAFKRLYWQGYEGRFGLFRWPGVYNGVVRPLDDSEFNAWRSAAGLLNLLANLNAEYAGNVYLMAHGYGATVAGEALRLADTNVLANTYVAMQGAVPSHAYDAFAPVRLLSFADSSTPNRYAIYYTNAAPPYFCGVGGADAYVNYFNTNDYVLTNLWRTTEDSKPDLGYGFDGTNFYKGYPLLGYSPLLFPTNTYEIFSYCDEARCDAIGAQPNLGGPFWSVGTFQQADLGALPLSFGGKPKDHSAQFLSYCAHRWDFWYGVLKTMGLKP
jgi:hypothetical protein